MRDNHKEKEKGKEKGTEGKRKRTVFGKCGKQRTGKKRKSEEI